MADLTLLPRSVCDTANVQIGPWTLKECPTRACVSATARRGQIASVAQDMQQRAGGMAVGIGDLVSNADCHIMGTARGQWFVRSDHTDLLSDLRRTLDTAASLTDQSDAWVCFSLMGPDVTAVLERCVMMDLAQLQAGQLQRGLLEHMNVFLMCHTRQAHYELMVARSYAQSLHHAVTKIMASAASMSGHVVKTAEIKQ